MRSFSLRVAPGDNIDNIDNFYNVERRDSYLGYLSPIEFELLSQLQQRVA